MTNKLELYKCNICSNIVEVVLSGDGVLVCCGADMELMNANTQDAALEKHVPVIEVEGEEKIIRIGVSPHPMLPEHYIQFIEVISEDQKYVKRKYLFPGDEPMMRLKCACEGELYARELCNIHGLWSNK